MKLIKPTPTTRVSLGLMLLTISILLTSELIGVMPDPTAATLDARKKLCESLAVQFSSVTNNNARVSYKNTLAALVERNEDVLSAGMRTSQGYLIIEAGDHDAHWMNTDSEKSDANNVQVPIYKNSQRWATVEVRFAPVWAESITDIFLNSSFGLTLFVGVSGFIGYFFFMRRTLRELDPSAVVPDRVKAAFDALAEGVIIIDEKEHIVLANAAFSKKSEIPITRLTGLRVSELPWNHSELIKPDSMPWNDAMRSGRSETGIRLCLDTVKGSLTLMANVAPIPDGKNSYRGVLITFDDVTELESKNHQLKAMVRQITEKNEELHYLATRDPMTGCLNRRSFYEGFELLFNKARAEGLELSFIMTDIDHFKSVNDNYGHSLGDDVIKTVAEIYKNFSREEDLVGRYGGEEFCLVLPGVPLKKAVEAAERIQLQVKDQSMEKFETGPHITSSFGVSSIKFGAADYDELCNQADDALYYSKEHGRNQVTA